ncbi:MAG: rod shape-determining protein RodA [Prolixibacteraceae bacterium]|nr:rod shape-determining protein RodA [Prolixibacteraceae bacterium]MBN2649992.1 rod shape-determining protein RodA [Prolixibacteraceae bacterium]
MLVIAGWLNIYSAVYDESHSNIFDLSQRYGKQILWIGFSAIFAFFLLLIDSKFYVSFGYVIYAFFIVLLIAVLFFGHEAKGAKSWLTIGGFAFQPAEFAKLGAALAVSKTVSSFNFSFKNKKKLFQLAFLVFLPVTLILLQNDTGSALVYFVFAIPLFREGLSGLILFFVLLVALLFIFTLIFQPLTLLLFIIAFALIANLIIRKRIRDFIYIFGSFLLSAFFVWLFATIFISEGVDLYYILLRASVLSALVLLVVSLAKRVQLAMLVLVIFIASVLLTFTVDFVFDNVLEPHHQARINNLLGIESNSQGIGYHVNQSKIAIGSGGLTGKGFLQGTQTKYDFVPEQSTDFIFCTVGEEWGFVGTSIVIFLFMALLIRIVRLAERQRSVFSRVFGYSVASILFFHFAVNIGMTIGLAPVIGIPLPFFSYGGSSLWFFTTFLFIFLKLDASRLEQLH